MFLYRSKENKNYSRQCHKMSHLDLDYLCIPISKHFNDSFQFLPSHTIGLSKTIVINNFEDFIQNKPFHIRQLISNYNVNKQSESLLVHLTDKSPLYISIYGAHENTKSGGRWLIATDENKRIIRGFNSDYGQVEDIHSYRPEVYASFEPLLFINACAEYFDIQITKKSWSIW